MNRMFDSASRVKRRASGRPVDFRGQPELIYVCRQIGLGLGEPVLNVDLIDVDVSINSKRDHQLLAAVVRADRLHVQHVVDAVHLLLDRCRDGLLDRDCVRAGVVGRDDNLRRQDLRKECER